MVHLPDRLTVNLSDVRGRHCSYCQELGRVALRIFLLCEAAAFYANIMRTNKNRSVFVSTLRHEAKMG